MIQSLCSLSFSHKHTQEGSCSFVEGLTGTLNTVLSSSDWAAIQANLYLATDPSNAYLSMQAGFLTEGSNSPISSSAALQVWRTIIPTYAHKYRAWLFQCYSQAHFVESVFNICVCRVFQDSPMSLYIHELPYMYFPHIPYFPLSLSLLLSSPSSSSLLYSLPHTLSHNQVPSNLFSPNTNPPSVVEALLDLDAGIMTLRLNEGSRYLASAPVHFIDNSNSGGEVTLTDFSTPNNVEFFYELPDFLQNSIKLASPPFSLSLPSALFEDGAGMTSPAQSGLAVTLIPDSTQPKIVAFTFDLDIGQLDLTFDEPIDLGTANLTEVYLTSDFQGSQSAISSVSGTLLASEVLNTELSFLLSISTLNSVKFDTSLCTSTVNCLLNVNSSAFSDTSGNPILASVSNIVAQSVISDTTAPTLNLYIINLDSSSITLTFSEPVDLLSFDPFGITLDIDQNEVITSGDNPIQYQSVTLGGANSIVDITERGTVIGIKLGTMSLIGLKVLIAGSNPITCTIEDFTVQDTSGNSVTPIPSSTSFQPSQIVLDQTPPILLEFIASPPESRYLTFVFSEVVDITTWNISALTLTLFTTQESIDYTFSDGTVEADGDNSNSVTFTIDDSEYVFSSLMQHYQEAYVSGSVAVTTRGSLIEDLFGNPLEPVIQPLLYNTTISRESPELLTVDFDLNNGRLDLTFSDLVVSSFPAGRIRFQDHPNLPTQILTLASNGSYSSQDVVGSSLSLNLGSDDLNGLKLNPFLATSTANTFVVLADNFAHGLGSVPLAKQNGTAVTLFTPDTQGPEVTRFELDLDSDTLSIDFSEPIPVHTFNESHIILLNSTTLSFSETTRLSLTNTFVLAQDNVTSLRALISVEDSIEIKRQPLCYSVDNCFVMFDGSLVSDISGNKYLTSLTPVLVDSVYPDVTPPQLVAFPVFDLDAGLFTLIFSEPVNGSSTDYAEVQFNNAPLNFNASVTLSEGFTSPDHIELVFHLSRQDLNRLKSNLDLCTSRDDCWIRLPSFFITDIGMNPFIHSAYQSDVAASFHQPSLFIPDQTSPELEYARMDVNQGTLTLSFSEVIVEATFSPNDVTLLSSPSSPLSLTLSPDSSYSIVSSGAEVTLQLTTDDLNWLKAQELFTSVTDAYLSLATNLIDVSGNDFQNILGFQVNEVVPDRTGPILVSFDYFNLESKSFMITFDEPVYVSSFDVTRVALVSQPSNQATTYTLTGATLISAPDDRLKSVMVVLTSSDRVQIKLLTALATMHSNTYIALSENAISDTTGNMNVFVPNTLAIPLSTGGYVPDTSQASVTVFGLDLDSSLLFLTFDDVIASSSIDSSSLTIQNAASSATSSVRLSHYSMPLNGNSDQVTMLLSQGDLLELKLDLNLATSASDTYISVDSDFVTDIEGRAIIAIPPTSALPLTSSFIPDTTSPSLSSFSLDMNTGTLLLDFSEPILPSSADPSQLSLHGQSSGEGSSLTLGQATSLFTTTATSLSVGLKLLQSDLNFLKDAQDLAIDTGTTFMSFTPGLVTDASSNAIMPVAANTSIAATSFIIDTTAPELRRFDADLTPVAKIYLSFSETVRLNGLIQDTVFIFNAPINPSVNISLTESDESIQAGLDQVEILFSPPIITQLLVDTIASSVDSLYLSLMEGVVVDTNGNTVVPVVAYRVDHLCEYYCIEQHAEMPAESTLPPTHTHTHTHTHTNLSQTSRVSPTPITMRHWESVWSAPVNVVGVVPGQTLL